MMELEPLEEKHNKRIDPRWEAPSHYMRGLTLLNSYIYWWRLKMESTTFSSIKNEIGYGAKVCHARVNELRLIRSLSDYNTFPGITTNDRMCSGRRFQLRAKKNPHMRTYSIRLDAGCNMSDYKC